MIYDERGKCIMNKKSLPWAFLILPGIMILLGSLQYNGFIPDTPQYLKKEETRLTRSIPEKELKDLNEKLISIETGETKAIIIKKNVSEKIKDYIQCKHFTIKTYKILNSETGKEEETLIIKKRQSRENEN